MRKCEKDFRRVFSFLSCLLDALPLFNLNFRKRKGLLTGSIIENKRESCLASYESLGFCAAIGTKIRHGVVPRRLCLMLLVILGFSSSTTITQSNQEFPNYPTTIFGDVSR